MSVTLSLRVTCDKRKPGVKPSTVKEENITDIIAGLRLLTQDIAGSKEYLDDLQKAVDLKSQLEILRQGFSVVNIVQEEKEKLTQCYYIILVEILLSLELKSPLRSGIIRILKDDSNKELDIIQDIISKVLKSKYCTSNNSSIPAVLKVANALCGCFDNFSLGVKSVSLCENETYTFITDNLAVCRDILRTGVNPAQDAELCQCTHTLVRAALHMCSVGKSTGDSQSQVHNDTVTTSDTSQSQLHELALQLVDCTLLPLDTRTNCGLLVLATGRRQWLEILKMQLSSRDDIARLCVFSGLLGSFSVKELSVPADLCSTTTEKTALQLIFDSIMDIHSRNPLQPTVTLSVARVLVSLSRVLLSDSRPLYYMLPRLLLYTWEHLEHVMDSVKHLAVILLHNIAKLHSPEVDVYGAILSAIHSLPVWGRAKYTALSTLLGKVPVSSLVNGAEDISCLYQHLNQEVTSSHAVSAFQDLMKHHHFEINDEEEWKELWVRPLLYYLDRNPSVPLQQVLTKAIIVCPGIINFVLSLPRSEVRLGTVLLCLRHAHKQGLLETAVEDGDKWRGLVDYSILRTAIEEPDEQACLSCLSLIVEAPKTSKTFTLSELKLIKEYVSQNLNIESPAARQRNIALLNKFVNRLNESRQVLERFPGAQSDQLLQAYTECQVWLEQSCVASLFPGASYSRRVTALQLLTVLTAPPSPTLAASLLACLADSYEEVKEMAMKLLTSTPGLLDDLVAPENVVSVLERSVEQAGGVKPPETQTAAYLLATLSQAPWSPETLAAVVGKYSCCAPLAGHTDIEHKSVLCCLLVVVERLTQQLSVASVSLLRAASSAPLYGLLFTAKLLLSQINLRECKSEPWSELISRLVGLSFSCSQAVASVVNNDSPEGHFPMDFDFDPTEGVGEDGVEGVTSQMVLLCSWRTVKEVSLLLGFLAEEASITLSPEDVGLLSDENLLKIGDHLTNLLAETKHRGAFEQAYIGFCKLVSRLWKLPAGKLRSLPLQWLEETMQEISKNNENLCATRRSAGLPFMIQALICTQLEVEGASSIEPWMSQLLDLAESATASPTTHTHALNILRALFRNTQLGEAVGVFVERAVIVTITAFSSSSWMERNSATLLLSALMTRVFGVPRSKSQDHLSWKNKMTGRIFFQRYPKLFGFFQQELRKACSQCDSLHPSLYPVLLVLGRLYPSSLEGTDSNVQLTQYIPDILVCSGSKIFKTRSLAASAMVPLMSWTYFDMLVNKVVEQSLSANYRHGLLLQIAYFLKHSDLKVDQQMFKTNTTKWIIKLVDVLALKLSFLELEAVFYVLNIFAEKCCEHLTEKTCERIIIVTKACLNAAGKINLISCCLLYPRMYELLLKLTMIRGGCNLDSLLREMLRDKMYEVRHTAFDFLCSLHSDSKCYQRFHEIFSNLPFFNRDRCRSIVFQGICCESDVLEIFMEITSDLATRTYFYHSEDKIKILKTLRIWDRALNRFSEVNNIHTESEKISFLVTMCKDSHEEIALNAVNCLSKFLCLEGLPQEDLRAICDLLEELLIKADISDDQNEAVYCLLAKHLEALQKATDPIVRVKVYKNYIVLSSWRQWASAVDRVSCCEAETQVIAVLLAALTSGQFVQQDQQTEVGRVFDKSEVNCDYEEYTLSKICGEKLHELCIKHEGLLSRPLTPSLRHWLEAETGLAGDSLSEMIALARISALQIDTATAQSCHFLSQGYQRLRLNSLKINNFL